VRYKRSVRTGGGVPSAIADVEREGIDDRDSVDDDVDAVDGSTRLGSGR
jgi:hypothetical protein